MSVKQVVMAAAGALGGAKAYIEDVFSTYLIKTPGSATSVGAINNGIDLSTEGGMVWLKDRNFAYSHTLVDTARGPTKRIISNTTAAEADTSNSGFTSFNTNGFTLNTGGGVLFDNGASGTNVATWTFRKAPKFFDVVTWTGNDTTNRAISHSLSSVPGAIIIKEYSFASDWVVWHRSLSSGTILQLNTDSDIVNANYFVSVGSSDFTVAPNTNYSLNETGKTYVAYLFAHDAGGFGDAGDQNVISCGSYTGNGSATGPIINLGWEPQWVLIKRTDTTGNWLLHDNMRGLSTDYYAYLMPNLSDAEVSYGAKVISPLATGFQLTDNSAGWNANGGTYIYIAIRRGPMKTPTDGTSVFSPVFTSSATGTALTTSFPVDMQILGGTTVTGNDKYSVNDRLRRVSSTTTEAQLALCTSDTRAEFAGSNNQTRAWNNVGFQMPSYWGGLPTIFYNFRRAPGFFDVVCYTGDGTNMTINHNLGVVPELMIVKRRSASGGWFVYSAGATVPNNYYLQLQSTAAQANAGSQVWDNTSTTFLAGTGLSLSSSGYTYVAYLFATVAGVSKVGSYTGTGTTLQVNCGFSNGARFVLIKRTDSTGDWYVWDSARGIVAGNDPYLLLNTTAAEVTSTDYVDTYSAGFEISSTAPAAINANGGTFIFLAIA